MQYLNLTTVGTAAAVNHHHFTVFVFSEFSELLRMPGVQVEQAGHGDALSEAAKALRAARLGQVDLVRRAGDGRGGDLDGGRARRLGLAQELSDLAGDLAPLWMPDYAEFFGDTVALKASGDTSAEGVVTLRALDLQAQAIALAGQVTLAADGLPLAFDLTGRIGLNNGTPVLLPLSGENQTRVRQATLAMTYDRTAGEGWSGRVAVDGLDRSGLAADQLVLDGSGRIWRRDGVPNLGATLDFAAEAMSLSEPLTV